MFVPSVVMTVVVLTVVVVVVEIRKCLVVDLMRSALSQKEGMKED